MPQDVVHRSPQKMIVAFSSKLSVPVVILLAAILASCESLRSNSDDRRCSVSDENAAQDVDTPDD